MSITLKGQPGRPAENLTKPEHSALKELLDDAGTFTQLSKALRLPRKTITRILKNGYGSPENIKKVRNKLSILKPAA
jgi:hypothetical protein